MGHTNSTANLSLPQFIGTDKPTWLGDVNGAFSAIDSYVGANNAAVAAAASDASSAISQAAAAVNTANTANTTAGNASTAANNAVGVANTANAIAGTVDSKVGLLADLTTTDRTSIVNAINEVNGKDAGDIAYDNTGSGLTATNVQAAIDEVAQGGGGGSVAWSLVGTATGSAVTLPVTFNELLILVEYNNVLFTFNIASAMLSSTAKKYRNGYYLSSTATCAAFVEVSDTSAVVSDFYLDGADVHSSVAITVYSR